MMPLTDRFLTYSLPNFFFPGPKFDRMRGRRYEKLMSSHGKNFKVAQSAYIFDPSMLTVGDDVYIGFCSYIGNGPVTLESEVLIGNHVSITAANHRRKNNSCRFTGSIQEEITVGAGTWIAAHSCLLAGAEVGSGCIVAAGSVVTKCFGDDVLIAGVPARVIRYLGRSGADIG